MACVGFLTLCASLIVSAEVFLRVTPGSLVLSLVSAGVICGAICWAAYRAGLRPGWSQGERPLLVVVLLVGTVLARRVFDWPFFAPRGFSVDGAHHGAIVEYIAAHLRFAEGTHTSLDRFAQYPNGGHLLAAIASRVTGMFPIRAMGLLAFICLLMILMMGGVVASLVTTNVAGSAEHFAGQHRYSPTIAALSVPVLGFAASRFTIGMIAHDYFFAQLVALALVCGGVAALVVFATSQPRTTSEPKTISQPKTSSPHQVVTPLVCLVLGLFSAASTFVYPLQIGLLPFAVGLVWLTCRERQWLVATLVSGLCVVAVLAFTIPHLGASRSMASDEGVIARPHLAELGGLATALFVCEGLLLLGSRGRRYRSHASVRSKAFPAATSVAVAGPFLAATAQTVGLLVIRHLPGLPTISRYTAYKNVYLAVPFGIVIAAIGVGHAWSATPLLRSRFASSILVGFLLLYPVVSATRRSDLTNASRPLVSEDAYRLLRDSRRLIGDAPIAILAPDIEPYALAWTALQRPTAALPNPYLIDKLSVANLPETGRRFVLVLNASESSNRQRTIGPSGHFNEIARRGKAVLLMSIVTDQAENP